MYIQGLLDLERQYLTAFGKSDITMNCQLLSPVFQAIGCFVFAIKLNQGIFGIAYATLLTNLLVYLLQNYFLRNL
jgi:Na+-driven multidrug efflux pump